MTSIKLKPHFPCIIFRRMLFKPPSNLPYCGIYRTDGEICRSDDLLVCQKRMNYHPGSNVRHQHDRGQHLLKANCDGTVIITREKTEVDPSNELMIKEYGYRNFENIYKLTFSVIPRKMSSTFKLVNEI